MPVLCYADHDFFFFCLMKNVENILKWSQKTYKGPREVKKILSLWRKHINTSQFPWSPGKEWVEKLDQVRRHTKAVSAVGSAVPGAGRGQSQDSWDALQWHSYLSWPIVMQKRSEVVLLWGCLSWTHLFLWRIVLLQAVLHKEHAFHWHKTINKVQRSLNQQTVQCGALRDPQNPGWSSKRKYVSCVCSRFLYS